MVYGVGRVTGSPQTLDDGHGSRAVTVAVSDFVDGETKASTVQLIFDFSTARWTRAPVPQPNTAIQFYGVCRELSPTGILRLKVDSTALNISSNALAPSDDTSGSAGSTASAPVTPSKRRKFDPTSLLLLKYMPGMDPPVFDDLAADAGHRDDIPALINGVSTRSGCKRRVYDTQAACDCGEIVTEDQRADSACAVRCTIHEDGL
ncbi:hypothetical protein B0H13DRAFT_2533582 [Mycena leptocephala]|nr:hypothetical protein B0H13DRAFT_2533582 [Mycena leptocephala]